MKQNKQKKCYQRWWVWVIMLFTYSWPIGIVFLIIGLKKDIAANKEEYLKMYMQTPGYKKERVAAIEEEINNLAAEAERLEGRKFVTEHPQNG